MENHKKERKAIKERKAAAAANNSLVMNHKQQQQPEQVKEEEEEEVKEAKEQEQLILYLPENQCYIPDITYRIYHIDAIKKTKHFRGQVQLPADFSHVGQGEHAFIEYSELKWYNIMHEDIAQGSLLVNFFYVLVI